MGKPLAEYKKHAHEQDQFPLTKAQEKELILSVAGFSPEETGHFMRLATKKLIEKLDAKKTEFFTYKGEIVEQRDVDDNGAQIRAAEALEQLGLDVAGLRQRASSEGRTPVDVHLDFSGWTVQPAPTPKDVTPNDA